MATPAGRQPCPASVPHAVAKARWVERKIPKILLAKCRVGARLGGSAKATVFSNLQGRAGAGWRTLIERPRFDFGQTLAWAMLNS